MLIKAGKANVFLALYKEKTIPLKSQAQRRYLWAKDPELAKQFERHTPKGSRLPKKVPTTRKKRKSSPTKRWMGVPVK